MKADATRDDQATAAAGLRFDDDGFLVDPATWSPETAREIAAADGLVRLSREHWKVICYLRDHYLRNGTLPVMHHVCRVNQLDDHCVDELFHGPKQAWRIAGLPNPGEEAKSYM